MLAATMQRLERERHAQDTRDLSARGLAVCALERAGLDAEAYAISTATRATMSQAIDDALEELARRARHGAPGHEPLEAADEALVELSLAPSAWGAQ